jgi:hypothetical protein
MLPRNSFPLAFFSYGGAGGGKKVETFNVLLLSTLIIDEIFVMIIGWLRRWREGENHASCWCLGDDVINSQFSSSLAIQMSAIKHAWIISLLFRGERRKALSVNEQAEEKVRLIQFPFRVCTLISPLSSLWDFVNALLGESGGRGALNH